MKVIKLVVCFAFAGLFGESSAGEDHDSPDRLKPRVALSKSAYDEVRSSLQQISEALKRQGVDWKDVDERNLQFASRGIRECLSKSQEVSTIDELSVLVVSCLKRHRDPDSEMLKLLLTIELGKERDSKRNSPD